MTITNDQIVFTLADFAGLSDPVKNALTGYLGDYVAHFSNALNAFVPAAKQHAKSLAAQAPSVAAVLESYANADAATRLAAEPLLASLNTLLNP